MDVDDDVVNDAGTRMSGDRAEDDHRAPAQQPATANTNTNTTSNASHLTTSRISSLSPQKERGANFSPEKSNTLHHNNQNTATEPETTTATTMPKKQPIKKKGTASTIKAPKRGGKGGGGSGGGSSKRAAPKTSRSKSKKPKTETGGGGGTDDSDRGSNSEGDGGGSDGDDESGSDQGIYCICRGPDNHRFMIACDRCEGWFHGDCIGMDKYTGEELVQRYICPNCTDGRLLVTRYKKTCALERCDKPARMYGDDVREGEASIFCSEEHCQTWWEKLVGKLPKGRKEGTLYGDVLTQEEFMGLLGTGKKGAADAGKEGWKLGDEPFGTPPKFWETNPPSTVQTEEESALLSASVTDRHSLGEEIVLCKKMMQLIDMAVKQRERLLSSSAGGPKSQLLGKDFCGYDYRLDTAGATAAFAAFVKSPAGEAIFRAGKLPLPGEEGFAPFEGSEEVAAAAAPHVNGNGVNGSTGGAAANLAGVVCVRKKCKPHAGWSGIHTKHAKHQIKELAAQAKEKLDFEARIRDCAAVRLQRRKRENNRVEILGGGDEMEE